MLEKIKCGDIMEMKENIRQMIKETDGDSYEKLRSLNQDLTFKYAEKFFEKNALSFGLSQKKTLGLIGEDDLFTNLALLLSEQCNHTLKVAVFEGIEKNIFKDRIEFVSLGGIVYGLSLDSIMLGVSQSRNEKLANIFYRLHLIEAYGTGIRKIFTNYERYNMKPTIKAEVGAFQVVLPNIHSEPLTTGTLRVLESQGS